MVGETVFGSVAWNWWVPISILFVLLV